MREILFNRGNHSRSRFSKSNSRGCRLLAVTVTYFSSLTFSLIYYMGPVLSYAIALHRSRPQSFLGRIWWKTRGSAMLQHEVDIQQ